MGQRHSKSDIAHQRESKLTDLPKASDVTNIRISRNNSNYSIVERIPSVRAVVDRVAAEALVTITVEEPHIPIALSNK